MVDGFFSTNPDFLKKTKNLWHILSHSFRLLTYVITYLRIHSQVYVFYANDDNISSTWSIKAFNPAFSISIKPKWKIQMSLLSYCCCAHWTHSQPLCYYSSTITFLEVCLSILFFLAMFPFDISINWNTLNTSICWLCIWK